MEVTLEITDYCPNACEYCSTNASPSKRHMLDYNEIATHLINLEESGKRIDRINISGGEPLAHPEFYRILRLSYNYTDNVWVYTNAIRQLIYNTTILSEVKVEANVCLVPGKEAYIPKNADKVHLLQLVPQGRAKDMKPVKFHASGNIIGEHRCAECNHSLLQADGQTMSAPCKKDYGCENV